MTFLKKLGTVIANIAGIAAGIGPILGAYYPKISSGLGTASADLQQIANEIITVETVGATLKDPSITGATKLQMATPLVAQVILQSSLLMGKKIAQPELYNRGVQKVADGMADILNSIHEDAVKVVAPQDVK